MNNKYILAGVSTAGTVGIVGLIVGTQLSSNTQEDTPKTSLEIDNPPVVPPPKQPYVGVMSNETKNTFLEGSLAAHFSGYLLDTNSNTAKGQGDAKYKQLNAVTPKSGFFKSAKSSNNVEQLKTICKQMFTYRQNQGNDIGSSSVKGKDQHITLGQETGEYCAAAPTADMPSSGPSKTIK